MNNQTNEQVVKEKLPSGVVVLYLGNSQEHKVSLTAKRLESLEKEIKKIKNELKNNNSVKGLIIASSNPNVFCHGADINLIQNIQNTKEGENAAKKGQDVFNSIAELSVPSIAAISGPCVGGGCELALACTYRIITNNESSTIGLPETKLGIIPGFGGTQRLPRLIGIRKALDIILGGKILRYQQAKQVGLVDMVCTFEQLISISESIILGKQAVAKQQPPLIDKILGSLDLGRKFVANQSHKAVLSKTKGCYPAQPAAIDTVIYGLKHGIVKGLDREAKDLGRLVISPESKSLVKLFFLTETAKSLGKPAKDLVKDVRALVVGAGVMGAGIAGTLARSGCSVILKDTNEVALQKGKEHILKNLQKSRSLSESQVSTIIGNIEFLCGEPDTYGSIDLVIEAIVEKMEVKKAVLGALADKLGPNTLICSNTSSLSLTEMSEGIASPERVLGMHFFNPVEKMPLIEIIRSNKTSDKAIMLIAAITNKLGKYPIIVNDVPGFLINRILTPYLNEAAFLLSDGFSVEAIDKAALKFGMPMGPLRLLDEVGLDVATHVAAIMEKGYGSRMHTPPFAKMLVEKGRLGRKNKAGFYDYSAKKEVPYSQLYSTLNLKEPITAGKNDLQLIQDRLIYSLLNEAICCLDEGVAGVPSKEAAMQIDLGTVMGIGFPPFRGGIIHFAEMLGAKVINNKLDELKEKFGDRFKGSPGIAKRATKNKSFYGSE